MAAIGGRWPSELRREATANDVTEMLAYQALESFGPMRDNYHAGLIASLLYNVNRGKNVPAKRVRDFMLYDAEEKRQDQTTETLDMLRFYASEKKDG